MKIYLKDIIIMFYGLISLGLMTWSLIENFQVNYEEPSPAVANVFGIGGSIDSKIPEVLKNKRIDDVQVFFNFPKSSGHAGPIDINNKVFYSLERVDKPPGGKQWDDVTFKVDGIKRNSPKELRNGEKKLTADQLSKLILITQLNEPKLLYFRTENTNNHAGIDGIYMLSRTKGDKDFLSKEGIYLTKRSGLNRSIYKGYNPAKEDIRTTLAPMAEKTHDVSVRVVDLPLEKISKLSILEIKSKFPSELNKPPVFSLIVKAVELPKILSPEELKIATKLSLVKPTTPKPDGKGNVVTNPGDGRGPSVVGGKPKEENNKKKEVTKNEEDRNKLPGQQVTDHVGDGRVGLEDRNKEKVGKRIPATKILAIAEKTKEDPEEEKVIDEQEDLVIQTVKLMEGDDDDDEDEVTGEDDRDKEKVVKRIPATKILAIAEKIKKEPEEEKVIDEQEDLVIQTVKLMEGDDDDDEDGTTVLEDRNKGNLVTEEPEEGKVIVPEEPKNGHVDENLGLKEGGRNGEEVTLEPKVPDGGTVQLPEPQVTKQVGDGDLDGKDPEEEKVIDEQEDLVIQTVKLMEGDDDDDEDEVTGLENDRDKEKLKEGSRIPATKILAIAKKTENGHVGEGVGSIDHIPEGEKVIGPPKDEEREVVNIVGDITDQPTDPKGVGETHTVIDDPNGDRVTVLEENKLKGPAVIGKPEEQVVESLKLPEDHKKDQRDGDDDLDGKDPDKENPTEGKTIPATKILPIAKETKKEPNDQDSTVEDDLTKKKEVTKNEEDRNKLPGQQVTDHVGEGGVGLEDGRVKEQEKVGKRIPATKILPIAEKTKEEPNEKVTPLEGGNPDDENEVIKKEPLEVKVIVPEEPKNGHVDEATGLDGENPDVKKPTEEPEVLPNEKLTLPEELRKEPIDGDDLDGDDLAKKKVTEEQNRKEGETVTVLQPPTKDQIVQIPGSGDEDDKKEEVLTKKEEDDKDGILKPHVTDIGDGRTGLEVDPDNGKVPGEPEVPPEDKIKVPDPATEDPDDGGTGEDPSIENPGDQVIDDMWDFFD